VTRTKAVMSLRAVETRPVAEEGMVIADEIISMR
jgi:hypothetical protein